MNVVVLISATETPKSSFSRALLDPPTPRPNPFSKSLKTPMGSKSRYLCFGYLQDTEKETPKIRGGQGQVDPGMRLHHPILVFTMSFISSIRQFLDKVLLELCKIIFVILGLVRNAFKNPL